MSESNNEQLRIGLKNEFIYKIKYAVSKCLVVILIVPPSNWPEVRVSIKKIISVEIIRRNKTNVGIRLFNENQTKM